VKDILEVLRENNFSNHKQAALLQVLNYALFVKNHPQDLCGMLYRKIQLLQQLPETPEKDNPKKNGTKRTQKVTTDVLMLLLQKSGISATSDDKNSSFDKLSYRFF
jgi:hypothetical protein